MTLGDIKPNADFISSTIQFMTTGGANAKTTFKGKQVKASYTYWTEDDEPANGAGWYLEDDEDTTVNQNSVIIPQGDGFLVSRGSDETDAGLILSGEVGTTPITKGFNAAGYHLVANPCPADITIGDITPNADFVSSTIQFMTTGGANAKTTFKGKQVKASYTYWTDDDEPANGAGWYLEDDEDTEVNQNELVTIPAGSGFLVSRSSDESDATVTLPSAL